MNYVIYLNGIGNDSFSNPYGFWTGNNYTIEGELFPVCENNITYNTKVYSSFKRAENALKACLNRGYAYVTDGEVKEFK